MMKESKFVRTKIVVGYVLIALIGLTAMIYVWRQTGALLEPDHSQQELRRRRGLVNQTLYHLYEAETYGQMLVAGYASYENRYKRELRLVRECIDSLRMRADDESQQMRLDTIVRLIAGKEQGIKALDRNLRSAGTATLLSENIQRMIPMLDSLSQPTIEPDTILVRDTVRVAPKKKRNFFRRFGDLFSPPKNDSQVVVKTRVRIDAPPRQMSLGDTIAVVLQDLEQRVTSERLALYDKAWREGLRLQRNNQQINQRIYRLIIDFEEEETAYLWERMQAREQVRRSSLVILGSVAAGSLLVMLLFVGILWRDVNRSNRYKRQLEAANRHNEALLEAREKLMLTITHDIKAPLGSIMGYIDLLTRLDLGKRGALYLDHMKSSADHLLELVTDLLDFYKLDSNKVAVNRIAFSPADLFTAVCTGFEPVAAAKGIELRCTLAAELSGQVAGDPSRVRQIAENLLSNAIKFTDRGFVAFDAWLEEGRLLFRVSDTGRGIGPEERERIFQEFVRLPSAGGVSGVGLGLSIVDRLVKLLGGTIELESEPGAGSRFLVAVPVGEAEDDASEKEAAAGMCPGRVCMEGGRPLRCLLVDDDPLQLEMTAALCRELGIETESCPFPEYAEKLVQESSFDLVFTDIQMPGVDGFEVLRRIRAVRAELPVVAVSARSDDESAYVERGFAAMLRKPFARAELVAVLRRVVPEAGVAPEECLPEEDAVRGFEALTAFARDDAEAAREIIRTFVAERGPCRNLAPGRARRRCGRFACDRSQNGADLHVAGRGGARCGIAPSGAFGRFCGRGFAQRSARCSGKGRRNCPGGKKRVSLRPLIPAGGVFRQEAVRSHHARTGSCRGSDASVPDDAGEGASPKRSVAGSLCGRLRFF